jgi:hypothetical protein
VAVAGLITIDALTEVDPAKPAVMVTVVDDATAGAPIVNVAAVCPAGTVTEEAT